MTEKMKSTEDHGMFFIPELNLLTKIYKDENGLFYVKLPNVKGKHYLGSEENE